MSMDQADYFKQTKNSRLRSAQKEFENKLKLAKALNALPKHEETEENESNTPGNARLNEKIRNK